MHKPKKFKVYFWKTYFRKKKKVKWVVEQKGEKWYASTIRILVPTQTEARSRNPHAVITGRGIVRAQGNKIVIA